MARTRSRDTVFHKVDSLKAAIVTANLRPRMKGDTMEYNTDNIRLRPNANIEELLARLPGLQIDLNGNITFNGEPIQHLLVDGEDIFGSSPTLVTRNFDASKISRVQVLDRKSDQTVFTGVDDGVRTKTLNLVLKSSAKDGYFGKGEAGGNTGGNYSSNAVLAGFLDKEQFTALGLAANTGVLGFTNTQGGPPAATSSGASGGASAGVSFFTPAADVLGATAGNGIPQFAAAALHYANAWNGTEDHVAGNYQYSHYLSHPITTTRTIQAQPDSIYQTAQQSQSANRQDQHWFYGAYDWVPCTKMAMRLSLHVVSSESRNQYAATGSSQFNDTLVNDHRRTIQDRSTSRNWGGELYGRRQLGRPGRVLSFGASVSMVDNNTNGYLFSLTRFYQPNGAGQNQDTVDQRKQIANHPLTLGGSLGYTEPLAQGVLLALSYAVAVLSDEPLQATYSRGGGKYLDLVDSLSSHFKTQNLSQRGIFNLQGKTQRLSYTLGSDVLIYGYRQKDLLSDSLLHQHYLNWAPHLMLNYTLNPATNFKLIYITSTQQPTIAQLTPIKNNNDPLHLILGNPDLRPALTHGFRLDVHRLKTWIMNLALNFSLTNNSISTRTTTDSLGRQISQPVNVDGGRSGGLNFSATRKLLGFDAGIHFNGIYSRSLSYVNADLSRNNSYTGSGGFSLNRTIPDKYVFQVNTNFTYFDEQSSVNPAAPIRYWTQNHTGSLTIFLLRNYEINTTANYTWQEKTGAFAADASVLLWNSYVSRNFLQNRLVIKAQLNNVLDKNAGISRSNVGNVNTATSTNILGRYWLLSVIYHFDKKISRK